MGGTQQIIDQVCSRSDIFEKLMVLVEIRWEVFLMGLRFFECLWAPRCWYFDTQTVRMIRTKWKPSQRSKCSFQFDFVKYKLYKIIKPVQNLIPGNFGGFINGFECLRAFRDSLPGAYVWYVRSLKCILDPQSSKSSPTSKQMSLRYIIDT